MKSHKQILVEKKVFVILSSKCLTCIDSFIFRITVIIVLTSQMSRLRYRERS